MLIEKIEDLHDLVQVDYKKGYEAIYWLSFYTVTFRVYGIHPGLNYGYSQEFLLLAL